MIAVKYHIPFWLVSKKIKQQEHEEIQLWHGVMKTQMLTFRQLMVFYEQSVGEQTIMVCNGLSLYLICLFGKSGFCFTDFSILVCVHFSKNACLPNLSAKIDYQEHLSCKHLVAMMSKTYVPYSSSCLFSFYFSIFERKLMTSCYLVGHFEDLEDSDDLPKLAFDFKDTLMNCLFKKSLKGSSWNCLCHHYLDVRVIWQSSDLALQLFQ